AVPVNGSCTTLTGLTLDVTYDVYVRNDCGGGQYSSNGAPVQFTINNGDDCSRVIDLSSEPNMFSATTAGATNDVSVHACGTFAGGDLYLSHPVGAGATITFFAAHDYAAAVSISYGSSCPGASPLTCEEDLAEFMWTNTTGSTQNIYWIQDGSSEGGFTLEWIYEIPCTENVTMELRTDNLSSQASWQILAQGTNDVVCQFNVPNDGITSPITADCCLPVGCYRLRVSDSGGDGFVSGGFTGGYQLRESGVNGRRIIDNFGNFSTGSTSAISNVLDNGTFCLPLSDDELIFSSCDKMDWVNYKYLVAHGNPAVSAEWVLNGANNVQDANSGYEFWIFDPNGTYSYRRFHAHNVSDGFSPASATRAARMKINGWYNSPGTPLIPTNMLLNVRVRGRINGVNGAFGPACKMMIDATRASCPLVKLQDDPTNTSDYSCGVSRTVGGPNSSANKLVALPPQFSPAPFAGGTGVRFQFRFRIPGEGVCIVRPPQTSPTIYLNWTNGPQLQCSKTYEVEVRVSKDQGATWCVDGANPACDPNTVTTWGKTCNVTTSACFQGPATSSMGTQGHGALTMYPNPNRGDELTIALSAVETGVRSVSVDIYDLTGQRISARNIAVADGFVNSKVKFDGELASGMYIVIIQAGTKTYTERLVIQK
ncbi:MAG: T9SS type A sorting domain-containing protein, partial [Flavobacteriales bacterium]|nr:T9SS type A sorting domain-containing protein [Flavobacteriales bacterium]